VTEPRSTSRSIVALAGKPTALNVAPPQREAGSGGDGTPLTEQV
jgi:hypothetical protein